MKELIYFPEKELKPIGGPAGYLYNLKIEMSAPMNSFQIDFLNEKNSHRSIINDIMAKSNRAVNRAIYHEPRMRFLKHAVWKSKHKSHVDLQQYDIVHFHGTMDMYTERKNLNTYSGIVVLTTHSPKVFFKENIEDYLSQEIYHRYKSFCDGLEEVDRYAFERADVIIFPCEDAEEPYYKSWNHYKIIRNGKDVRYLLTGIIKEKFKKERSRVREELNIPQDAFVIAFVGRHNEVKGYDRLIEIFQKFDNIYVICCGNISHISPPDNGRWHEIGWTDDAYSYVNASDLFILPNRETYFDLSLLQNISIGKPALISNTGGNKYFKGMEDVGIYLFDDLHDAEKIIKDLMSKDIPPYQKANMENFFINNFSSKVFLSNYVKLIEEINEEYSQRK